VTTDTALAIVLAIGFVAILCGLVGWILTRLIQQLRAERARQDPHTRTPLALVLVPAAAVVLAAVWYFDDVRAGLRLALAGLALVGLIAALRRTPR